MIAAPFLAFALACAQAAAPCDARETESSRGESLPATALHDFNRDPVPKSVRPSEEKLRLEAVLVPQVSKLAPYYGPGNQSIRPLDSSTAGLSYFARSTVGRRLVLQLGLASTKWQPYFGYGHFTTEIRAFGTSWQSAPRGLEGGATGYALFGLIHDTRENEISPRRGASEELSLRLAGALTGSRYSFGQLTFLLRRFIPLGPRLVLAGRLAGDLLFGDVPFFELASFGGINPFEALGGANSLRGLPSGRYSGTAKVLANLELRAVLAQPTLLRHHVDLGTIAFVDAGRTWSPRAPNGPWHLFHGSVGAGLRVASGPLVLRLDLGVSPEGSGLCVGFGHIF
jgi:outer membrane protein assembly factor BamA